jgi:hypothetical protein
VNATSTKLHPIDFDRLEKGTWIEAEEIESATFSRRNEPLYNVRALGLAAQIEKRTGIVCKMDGHRLRLMTDSEALSWTIREGVKASRRLDRSADRLAGNIDRRQLSDAEKRLHEHATRVITSMASAQRLEREKAQRLFTFLGGAKALPEDGDEDQD